MEPKLSIEIIPESSHGINVRSLLSGDEWDVIKRRTNLASKYTCEICGHNGTEQGKDYRVECHEVWKYDFKNRIQSLAGFQSLCPYCHSVKHYARSCGVNQQNIAFLWLCTVNGWSNEQGKKYIREVKRLLEQRRVVNWNIDISYVYKEFGFKI